MCIYIYIYICVCVFGRESVVIGWTATKPPAPELESIRRYALRVEWITGKHEDCPRFVQPNLPTNIVPTYIA